jgi:hypothetical protein
MRRNFILYIMLALIPLAVAAQASYEYVGQFNPADSAPPSPWQVVRFDNRIAPTVYRVIEWDGVAAVEAVAEASMALLARPLDLDLEMTPVLCWRWRIDAPVQSADMAYKASDDYAARVYLSFRLPRSELNFTTRIKLGIARGIYGDQVPDAAINYIWDNKYPVGTQQANAYTDRTQMFVLRTGSEHAGLWVEERRDVLVDAKAVFGDMKFMPVQLAMASDTDNTGETARAGFADLHFVAQESGCKFPQAYAGA